MHDTTRGHDERRQITLREQRADGTGRRSGLSGLLGPASGAFVGVGTITCISGRGVLDDAVTAMMAQVLEKRGFGVRQVERGTITRDPLAKLDPSETKLICLSQLEVGARPATCASWSAGYVRGRAACR